MNLDAAGATPCAQLSAETSVLQTDTRQLYRQEWLVFVAMQNDIKVRSALAARALQECAPALGEGCSCPAGTVLLAGVQGQGLVDAPVPEAAGSADLCVRQGEEGQARTMASSIPQPRPYAFRSQPANCCSSAAAHSKPRLRFGHPCPNPVPLRC